MTIMFASDMVAASFGSDRFKSSHTPVRQYASSVLKHHERQDDTIHDREYHVS